MNSIGGPVVPVKDIAPKILGGNSRWESFSQAVHQ